MYRKKSIITSFKKKSGVKFDSNSLLGKEISCYYLNANELWRLCQKYLAQNQTQYTKKDREQSPTKEMEIKMFEFPDFDNFMHLETEGSDKWVQLRYSICHLLNTVWHATVWISSLTNHKFNPNIYHFVLMMLWRIQLLIKTYLCVLSQQSILRAFDFFQRRRKSTFNCGLKVLTRNISLKSYLCSNPLKQTCNLKEFKRINHSCDNAAYRDFHLTKY